MKTETVELQDLVMYLSRVMIYTKIYIVGWALSAAHLQAFEW